MIAILVVSFFLSVAFRFFLVLYAEGFVKKGTLEVKLLKQIYWLVWVVLVTIGLIPFAIAPTVVGDFPRDKYRSRLCLGVPTSEEENGSSHLFLQPQCAMALMAFYMVRFVRRVKKYVHGQCPRGRMSSIGKYQRNVIDLNTTYTIALILHCFTFVIKFFRQPTQNLDKSNAFLINFIVFDSFIYILSCCVFLHARSQEIPDRKDVASVAQFYASKAQVLQPRRPAHFQSQSSNQTNVPMTYLVTPVNLKYPKERANRVGSNISKSAALIQPDTLTASSNKIKPKPKSCDNFGIRRKIVDNKIHPIVTIYNSKAKQKIRARDESFKTDQAKEKKVSKKLEKPPIVSDDHSIIDFLLADNPNAIIDYPSEVLLLQIQRNKEDSEKANLKKVPGKTAEKMHKFRYFPKI